MLHQMFASQKFGNTRVEICPALDLVGSIAIRVTVTSDIKPKCQFIYLKEK